MIFNHISRDPEMSSMRYEDGARQYQITLSEHWRDCSRHPAFGSVANYVQTRPIALIDRSGNTSLPNLTIQTYDIANRPTIQSPMDYAILASSNEEAAQLSAPQPFSHDTMSGVRWEYAYNGALVVHSVTDYYLDGRTLILVSSVSHPDQFAQDKQEIFPMLDSFRFTPNPTPATLN